jgi:drug/metabolite transporter (DMT)-like permease
MEPVFATLMVITLPNQRPNAIQLLGSACILGGLFLTERHQQIKQMLLK